MFNNTFSARRPSPWGNRIALVIVFAISNRALPVLAQSDATNLGTSYGAQRAARSLDLTSPQIDYSPAAPAGGEDAPASEERVPERFSLHAQFTNVTQYHPRFRSPFRGPNSLDPGHRGNETVDATLYAGIRVWDGLEFYANPEVDQGFGLSNTLGVAGFPSGEAYKVGAADPYIRLPRAFFRYTLGLGGAEETIEPGINQLAGKRQADNLTFTVGKFAVTDIFDT